MKKLSEMSISEMLESATDAMNLFIEEDFSSKNHGDGGKDAAPKKENNEMDKREAIREIMAISAKPVSEFEGGEEEKVETIAKLAEKIAYNPSKTGANDEEPKKEDKTASETGAKDEEPKSEEEKKEDRAKAMDAMEKEIIQRIERKGKLAQRLKPFIGAFDHADMTEKEMAVYACEKLGKKVAQDEAVKYLEGYLDAAKQPAAANVVMDESPRAKEGQDEAFDKYLKGE